MQTAQFTKDIVGKKIVVEREFDAPVSDVWNAWTNSDALEKWWAPKPYTAVTKSFEFKEGGHWHYYMLGPDGTKQYCWAGYDTITEGESFSGIDAFCDEAGNLTGDMPQMYWRVDFFDQSETAKVVITITFKSEDDMKKIIEMGFEEGFTMGLNNLDEVLAKST